MSTGPASLPRTPRALSNETVTTKTSRVARRDIVGVPRRPRGRDSDREGRAETGIRRSRTRARSRERGDRLHVAARSLVGFSSPLLSSLIPLPPWRDGVSGLCDPPCMADPRSRRTGEHNPQLIRLIADAAAMREHIDALEARVQRLEAELAAGRKSPAATSPATSPAPPAVARPSKRPVAGPPPLPKMLPTMPAIPAMPASMSKAGGRRSIVDISEIAELVESIPPPAPGPPRPRK
jgi:hypothetical protein